MRILDRGRPACTFGRCPREAVIALTSIEWTDRTLNPGVYGCQIASPACQHCYAAALAHRLQRMGQPAYGGLTEKRDGIVRWTGEVRVDYDAIAPTFAKLPRSKPTRVFVTSMADLFHADVPFDFVDRVFDEMRRRPHVTFQVLTKRTARMAEFAEARGWPRNAWAGSTVEDQRRADERIPHLRRVPAVVRFLSMEPLLGPVDLRGGDGVGWVIAGGESGRHARITHPDWFRSLRDQCAASGIPFFFKQWGEWSDEGVRVGKGRSGRLLDRVEHSAIPEVR